MDRLVDFGLIAGILQDVRVDSYFLFVVVDRAGEIALVHVSLKWYVVAAHFFAPLPVGFNV